MSLFSRLRDQFARIIERLNADEETRRHLDEESSRNLITKKEIARLRTAILDWKGPEQLPTSAETVFLAQFQRGGKRPSFRKSRGPITIAAAWNELSFKEREGFTAKAKKNEAHNIAHFAKFNTRCPLSLSVKDISSTWPSLSEKERKGWVETCQRRMELQHWKRYRCDHPRACGGRMIPVPETPFRMMDLPFELRREVFSLVLSQSFPVLQLPSDGSADVARLVDVRLFAVSRQVFAEAVKVFYEMNTFGITTLPSSYYKDIPLFIRQSTGNEPPRPTNSIKRVYVHAHWILTNRTEPDKFFFLWKTFCDFLSTCKNLRKVEIIAWWIHYSHEATVGAMDLQTDKLSEILMDIRGIKQVVCSDVRKSEGNRGEYQSWRVRRITGIMVPFRRETEAEASAKHTQSSTA